ncbi:MAG: 3-phosphoshikimate 1-carboxyvinyltransferase [Candidatus Diapherotrites archaeon]|nr:3-phosphoshikimate 1-carboxyvinyltransferase [Candidatus Diapherotrites archaeon]
MIEIKPLAKPLRAVIEAPPSKAHTLRALFIAALAEGKTVIRNALLAEDQLLAINALREFGVKIVVNEKAKIVTVYGTNCVLKLPDNEIFVGNSGVTMRFLASFAALAPKGIVRITGDERMQKRPLGELLKALQELRVKAESVNGNDCPPIAIHSGGIHGGTAEISGKESSQFFSSILIAAPFAKEKVVLKCSDEMKSTPYIDITMELMKEFGAKVENKDYEEFTVPGKQKYLAKELVIEGDFSNASYFFAASAIKWGIIRVKGLNPKSKQGDKIFLELLEEMGCHIFEGKDFIEVKGLPLKAITVDMHDYPDIVPTLAVVACFAEGTTIIKNIEHLRIKESDRILAIATQIKKLGAKYTTGKDFIEIKGITKESEKVHSAEIECFNDHRIAMAFSIAGLKIRGVKILDEKCVQKSFPDFFQKLEELRINRIKEVLD